MIDTAYTDTGGSAGFCRNLDGGLHGAIHVNIGTSRGMGAIPFAASDPIFWIHHCSIDRVWASWNRAGGRNPTDATFLDEAFVFADGNGQRVRRTVGEMIDASPRDYVYDRYLDRPEDSPPFSEQPFVVASRSFASRPSASGVQLGAGARRVELDTGVATGAPVPRSRRFSAPAPAAPGAPKRRYYLRLEDVRTNAPPGIGYDVYINVPQGGRPTRSDAGYAGTINFFGSVPHEHSGHARRAGPVRTNNVSLDVTRVVEQLRAQGRDTGGLSVTLVPVGTPNANTTPTIGRISLMS
jgi:tyrosinase